MPEDIVVENEQVEEQPEEVVEIVEEVAEEPSSTKEANEDDLSDLFRVPKRGDPDMKVDDLVSVSEEDIYGEGGADMSDLTEVSDEDIMGEANVPTPPPQPVVTRRIIRKVRRTSKPYQRTPPTSMGGLRG